MNSPGKCSVCDAELSDGASDGLCLKCLLGLGLSEQLVANKAGGDELLGSDPLEPRLDSALRIPHSELGEIGKAGERVGRYKLLQQIGEGGFGVVYMAEQLDLVRRRVALKIIKLGMDTKQFVARFEAERQALALMDHANIAKVYDAGSTETGRPYFVMELVKGIPITRYCDENNLSTKDRLNLVVQVCQAIQHAHVKGIIHRDIKPSNILVADHDGVPVPKVIDFGIAKATTGQPLTNKTLFTAFDQFMGTPAYMSPEQARLSGLDIDTRSDIYSLGVLLYEVLAGKPPFDTKRFLKAELDEMFRIIREEEPLSPSDRLNTLEAAEQTTIAKHHRSDPAKLCRIISGDLDWIVMKALEKDRARRYQTANGLAMDIKRYLTGEPVEARPVSQLYRFQKLLRRNKLVFASAFAVGAALVVGLGIAVWQYLEKSEAYQRVVKAEKEERSAREEAQQAQGNEAQRRMEAQAAGTRLADALSRLELQEAEELFKADNSSSAVAHLAYALRQNSTNRVAAQRLFSALTYRNFPFQVEILKHESSVFSAEFSPDGQRVVTTCGDKSVRIWDADNGRLLIGSLKHESDLCCAHFSPDGRRIVTACGGGGNEAPSYAQIWDTKTGQPLNERIVHNRRVSSAVFSLDGLRLATASFDGMRITDASSGQLLQASRGLEGLIGIAFSPDGKRVVTASIDGTAQLWDGLSGKLIGEPLRHSSLVTSVEFSSNGQRVLTASSYQIVVGSMTTWGTNAAPRFCDARVWDANTGQALTPPLQHKSGVSCARFSPDCQRVVTASEDNTAQIWDAQTGQPLTEPLKHAAAVFSAEFSPDGMRVVTASGDKTARIWDARTGRPLTESMKHWSRVRSAHFSPNGQRVVTACEDGTACIWDARPRTTLPIAILHDSSVSSARFSPDSKRIVTASYDGTARISDAQNGSVMTGQMKHPNTLHYAAFSPDGLRVVTAMLGGSARVWDAQTGRPITDPLQHSNNVIWAQFSPDGLRIVTASQDKTARVWDAKTGRPLTEPLRHTGVVGMAEFSPDGREILTASFEKTARVWDAKTGQPLTEPLRHDGSVVSAHFSPDGTRVVTASADNTAQIWDANTGHKLLIPLKHEDQVISAEFSHDSQRVVTASADTTARVWDANTGQVLTPPLQHGAGVSCARFSSDGQWVVTASWDKTARVWDTESGQPVTEALQHESEVTSAEFSPDGRRLVTVSGDGALVWEMPTVPVPVPNWVIGFAEAIGQSRLDDHHVSQPVPLAEFQALKRRSVDSSDVDAWTLLAKWLFADPITRTISPVATATVEQYIEKVISKNSPDYLQGTRDSEKSPYLQRLAQKKAVTNLQEIATLVPTNGLLLARLSHTLLSQEPSQDPRQLEEAQWLTDRAVQFAPSEWEAWRSRAEALERHGDLSKALDAINEATAIQPQSPELWKLKSLILEKNAQTNEAEQAFTRAIELATKSSITLSSYVRLIDRKGQQSYADHYALNTLPESVKSAPIGGLGLALLARAMLAQKPAANSRQLSEADFYSRQAIKLAPNEADVQWASAEVFEQSGRLPQALAAMKNALDLQPQNPELWESQGRILEESHMNDEAYQSFTKAIEKAGAKAGPRSALQSKFYLSRSAFLKRQNRIADAAEDFRMSIPPRDIRANLAQLDLSPHYNASLADKWHAGAPTNLDPLPYGLQILAGVEFDVRGIIQVGAATAAGEVYPKQVRDIPIGRLCKRLHFLHSAINATARNDGLKIGSYTVHLADGQQFVIPLIVGQDLADWWSQPNEQNQPFVVAWKGTNELSGQMGRHIRLFKMTWENPHPEVFIKSIDFLSSTVEPNPFLVAITSE